MFDQLFQNPHVLARQRNGPLAEERRRYLAHCAEQQMSPRTLRGIASYTLVVAKALRLADRPGELITRAEIEAEADRWANRQPKPPKMANVRARAVGFTGHAIRWLTFLGRLQPPAAVQQPYAEHVAQFADYHAAGTRVVAPNRRVLTAGRFTSSSRRSRKPVSGSRR